MAGKPLVFISHIAEEKELANIIKDEIIDNHLLGSVDVFVSSDSRVNSGGQSWLKNIEEALQKASVYLVLASPNSVKRPWINIEAGAGWVRQLLAYNQGLPEVYVMPLCHSGQAVSALPKPWDTLNAIDCNTVSGLQEVLNIVGKVANLTKIPKPNFDSVLLKIQTCEDYYSKYSKIENAIKLILDLFPQFKPVFLGQIPQGQILFFNGLPKHEIDSISRQKAFLENEGLAVFQTGRITTLMGVPNSGTFMDWGFNVTPQFMSDVLGKIKI